MRKNTVKKAHVTLLKTEFVFIIGALFALAFTFGFFTERFRDGSELMRETISASDSVSSRPAPSVPPMSYEVKVNINTASAQELGALPGIGSAIAERIISYREAKGGFKSVEEIKKVNGIGEKTFEKIRHQITVG